MFKFKVTKNKVNGLFSTGTVELLPVVKTTRGKFVESAQAVDNWEIVPHKNDASLNRAHKKYLKESVVPLCFNISFQDMVLEEVVELAELMVKTYKPHLTKYKKRGKVSKVKKVTKGKK